MTNPLSLVGQKCNLKKPTEVEGIAGKIEINSQQEFRIVAYDKKHYKIICDLPASDFLSETLDSYTQNAIRRGLIEEVEVFLWLKRKEFELIEGL